MGAHGQQDAVIALGPQVVEGEVGADLHAGLELHAHALDAEHLGLEHLLGQPVVGDAHGQHAAGNGQGLEDFDFVAFFRKVIGGGEPGRARAHDGDLLAVGGLDEGQGQRVSARQLADMFRRLEDIGVHSLSLITATHFLPAVLEALSLYRPKVPIVYNCGGFERVEVVRALADVVDVWLPDIKNHSPRISRLLLGRSDYFEAASTAVRQMCALSGPPQYDAQGIMTRGTLVRHLVIPGCATDSIQVLRFIADELPPGTPISLMRQYTPIPQCTVPGLDRRVTDAEYRRVLDAALALGLTGYLQDAQSADSAYTPPFDGTGVFGAGEMR